MSPAGTCILSYQLPFSPGRKRASPSPEEPSPAEGTGRSRNGRFPAVSGHRKGSLVVYRRRERRIELRGQFELREKDPEVSAALLQSDDPGVLELPEEVGH